MNQNIYEPPKGQLVTGPVKVSLKQKILCTLFAIFTASLYRGIYKVTPQFAETFAAFGSELPWLTSIAVDVGHSFLWIAIISLLPCLIWFDGFINIKYSLFILKTSKWMLLVALLMFSLNLIAMYLPIFAL
ncbi:MAG: hypothetical protein B0W54_04400 [Cellvibrio sp. 79]|nr:MAG: hypothetical protein B0W54_04400 [Cellvibrio sp. 79]